MAAKKSVRWEKIDNLKVENGPFAFYKNIYSLDIIIKRLRENP